MLTFSAIEAARRRLAGAIPVTPCARSEHLSRVTGTQAYLKLENLQFTGAFKERGALNKIIQLTDEEKKRGVICASAGNHAQGVAYHAARLGVLSVIVMPVFTPLIKVTSTRNFGAEVILHGDSFEESHQHALKLAAERGMVFVHPFNDDDVMAGQGTIGLELLEQNPYLQAVLVPIGGGGLISGIAVALKETNPRVKIIGVETEAFPSMKASIAAGHIVKTPPSSTVAEGIAVREPGDKTFEVVKKYVDDIVTVSEEEIANAILFLLEREKTVAEGAGAAGVAALLNAKVDLKDQKVCAVVCGGNIDVNVISRIIERGLIKDGRRVRLTARLMDQPGSLARLLTIIAQLRANVLEVQHTRVYDAGKLGVAEVDLDLETRGHDHVTEILGAISAAGFETELKRLDRNGKIKKP